MSGNIVETGDELMALIDSPGLQSTRPPSTPVQSIAARIVVRDFDPFLARAHEWTYTPYGVFASGTWETSPDDEADVLIPYTSIIAIQFDHEALEAAVDQLLGKSENDDEEQPEAA